MVKLSDDTPEAALLQKQQSLRLHHLRRAMGLSRADAAAMAGVSRFTWRRMEEGKARIDTVPLRRFLAAYDRLPNLSGEYVLSGSTAGMPELLVENLRELARAEPDDSMLASSGNHAPPAIPIKGKPRSRRKGSSARSQELADQEAA